MGNRVSVQFCTFQNINDCGDVVGPIVFGYRIYDDYDQAYNNCYESVQEMIHEGLNEHEIFDFISENHFEKFFDAVEEAGVYLNDKWIEYPKGGNAHG